MNKKLIFGIGLVLAAGSIIFIRQGTLQTDQNQELILTPTAKPLDKQKADTVPLPRETDIINIFFQLIAEGKSGDAVMMMTSNITGDDAVKQAYGVQFHAMNSVKVKKIEESSKADWTESWHQYMITIDVVMDPGSKDGPIPYYGFEKGDNIRFINLLKEGSQFKIQGLSTGP